MKVFFIVFTLTYYEADYQYRVYAEIWGESKNIKYLHFIKYISFEIFIDHIHNFLLVNVPQGV